MTSTTIHSAGCLSGTPTTNAPNICPSDEFELLKRIGAGDERGCKELIRQHGGRMLAVARRFLRSAEDSADAVQEAFLSAFRSLDGFEGNSTLGTWLHRIVVNVCRMRLRARSRRREVRIDDLSPTLAWSGHHSHLDRTWMDESLEGLLRAEIRAHVRACIDRLPDPYRVVLLLRDIEEFDTEQTAQHLGLRPGAVKTRLHRARQALRALLEPLHLAIRG